MEPPDQSTIKHKAEPAPLWQCCSSCTYQGYTGGATRAAQTHSQSIQLPVSNKDLKTLMKIISLILCLPFSKKSTESQLPALTTQHKPPNEHSDSTQREDQDITVQLFVERKLARVIPGNKKLLEHPTKQCPRKWNPMPEQRSTPGSSVSNQALEKRFLVSLPVLQRTA